MLLDSTILSAVKEGQKNIIRVIIFQINMLICFFNDFIDVQLVHHGALEQLVVRFDPMETLRSVISMFESQA